MYKIGDRFRYIHADRPEWTTVYMLAQASAFNVTLIDLTSGNRWSDPVKVNDPYSITEQEWRLISYRMEMESFMEIDHV